MTSENAPEQKKLSELESKLSNTQRINKDLIKEQMLAKKVIELVFHDLLFLQKASNYEGEELQEFVQQELQKHSQARPVQASSPQEDLAAKAAPTNLDAIFETDKAKLTEAEARLKNAQKELAPLKMFYEAVTAQLVYSEKKELDEILNRPVTAGNEKAAPKSIAKFILEKLLDINTEEQEIMKRTIKAFIGTDVYDAAMALDNKKERYEQMIKSFKLRVTDIVQKEYMALTNSETRKFTKENADKGQVEKLTWQVEMLKKDLETEKARADRYKQSAASAGTAAKQTAAVAVEPLQKEYLELSHAFYTLNDLVKDYFDFVKSLELLKDNLLKNMEGK